MQAPTRPIVHNLFTNRFKIGKAARPSRISRGESVPFAAGADRTSRIRRTSNLLILSTAYRRQVRLRACGKVSANLPPAVLGFPAQKLDDG